MSSAKSSSLGLQSRTSVSTVEGLTISADGLNCAWHGRQLALKGKRLEFLKFLSQRFTATYDEIHAEIWGKALCNTPISQRRHQINNIHQLVGAVRGQIGPEALIRSEKGYQLETSAIKVPIRVAGATSNQTGLRNLSVGSVVSGDALRRLLYNPKIDSERTVLRGHDPLRDLLVDRDQLLRALERRSYWLIATSAEDVAVSLAELARRAKRDSQVRDVKDRLRVILVEEEVEDLSLVLESSQLRFILASDQKSAVVQAKGDIVTRGVQSRLGLYGAQNRGPVVRIALDPEVAALRLAKFEDRFRSACGMLEPDTVDDIATAWFRCPEPRPAKSARQPNASGIGNTTQTRSAAFGVNR